MSLFRGYLKKQLDNFGGPWPLLEPSDIPDGKALRAENVEYLPGLVKTRQGYVPKFTAIGDGMTAAQFWFTYGSGGGEQGFLAYLAQAGGFNAHPGEICIYDTDAATTTALWTPSGSPVGACLTPAGPRLFSGAFDAEGMGTDEGRVYGNPNSYSSGGVDKIFVDPMAGNAINTASSGFGGASSGVITAGAHKFGLFLVTRNGFSLAPHPYVGFAPIPYSGIYSATAPGGTNFTLVMNAAWPTYAAQLVVLMTPANQVNTWYEVPGSITTVPGGTTATLTVVINIDDDSLTSGATPFTNFNLLMSTNAYRPKPSWIVEYNNRMSYVMADSIGVSSLAISDPDNYTAVTPDQHILHLPGQKRIISAFVLYRTLYVLGPHWTYQYQDTGDVPVTWPNPSLVDGKVGTHAPRGVAVNASRGIAWVADTDGLYVFQGGAYGTRPVSYYQTPIWNRINWAEASLVQVVDDMYQKRVRVAVPLDGATVITHILTFDYAQGWSPETINFSMDFIGGAYQVGAICTGHNDVANLLRFWVAPLAYNGAVLEQAAPDGPSVFADNGGSTAFPKTGIQSTYQTSLMPHIDGVIYQHHAGQYRLEGAGTTFLFITGLDGKETAQPAAILEAGAPAQLILRKFHVLSEAISTTVQTKDVGSWFQLSQINHWYSPWLMHR